MTAWPYPLHHFQLLLVHSTSYIKKHIYIIYIYIIFSSRKPADSLAHDRLCSLITNTQRRTHITSLRVIFHLDNTSEPRQKSLSPFFYRLFLPPIAYLRCQLQPHTRTLYKMLAYHFILHTHVAQISTSPLPATLCPLYLIYIYIFFIYIYCIYIIYIIFTYNIFPHLPYP